MMEKWAGGLLFRTVLLSGVLLLGATAGHAEEGLSNPFGFTNRLKLTLGVYTSDTVAPDLHDRAWYTFSLSYSLRRPDYNRLVNFSAYMDGGSGSYDRRISSYGYTNRTNTRDFYGAGLSMDLRLTPPNRDFGIYGLVGAGGYTLGRSDTVSLDDTENPATETISARNTLRFGYKLGGGLRFGRGYFLEAAYFNLGRLEDVDYNGYGISLGLRL